MRLPDFAHATAFRWTLAVAGAFVMCTLLLFGFVYWQTASYITSTIDDLLTNELRLLAADTPEQRLEEINERLRHDPRRIRIAGLFGADAHRIAGNLERLPSGLVPDLPANAAVVRIDIHGREMRNVRLAEHVLSNGEVLVIGRGIDELAEIADIVRRALALGLLPALGLAIAVGMVLSSRAHERLSEINRRIQRIVAGDLRERLPTRGRNDSFDQLSASVNAGVGDDIAHDVRTPLTSVRIRLERGRANASTLEELRAVVDQSIAGLDQSLAIITALLRISEIEHSHRTLRVQPGPARASGARGGRSLRPYCRRQGRRPSGSSSR